MITTNIKEKPIEIDKIDREILNRIQGDFPISLDPYGDIGKAVGISGKEALERVVNLVERGILRKVGAFFDAKKIGYTSTLCSVDVESDKLKDVVSIINNYHEVTHNYLREGSPNVWFTLIAESKEAIERILSDISRRGLVGPIYNLPALKTFKVKVDLKLKD